jgi:hypothetical protein
MKKFALPRIAIIFAAIAAASTGIMTDAVARGGGGGGHSGGGLGGAHFGRMSAGLPRTPLLGQARGAARYNPPRISNPSQRIGRLNQSFRFNRGVENNPAGRDSYLRYNFNR